MSLEEPERGMGPDPQRWRSGGGTGGELMGLFLVTPADMPRGLEGHRRERGHELGAGVLNLGFLFWRLRGEGRRFIVCI